MTRKKEEFKPLIAGQVSMYVCGPTVYDFLHVGNFFGAIFFNIVRNWLEKKGYKVTFVYNYTDIDDKIIQRSLKDGVASSEISEKYIKEFEKDYETLKLKKHSHNPKVTEFLPQIITFIKELVTNEHAYVLDGDVYYDVTKFSEYGKLSNKNIDELMAGTRVNINEQKKHVVDFALWKASKPGEPSWDSPWGPGRPGWHIECSCMAHTLLGETIDIHGGGLDLIFPHHENEIAQSEGRSGKPFARYWMHNNMLVFSNQKMSKSLGNVRSGRSFMEEYNGEILKFMILSSHYRSNVDFSQGQIERSIGNLARFYSSLAFAEKLKNSGLQLVPVPKSFLDMIATADEKIALSLDDDFNTPEVMAAFYEVMRVFNNLCRVPGKIKPDQQAIAEVYFAWLRKQAELMAIFQEEPITFLHKLDDMILRRRGLARENIDKTVAARTRARIEKNYALSDELRDELNKMGVLVQDAPEGSTWEVDKTRL
ncbi:MAG: cysteine--tRNA ligase [Bdellovibrionales bacterium RBG_16_40_8]|nr:MAG: cysteine--tRNA ligase [Bdellovibrionales bacterium RBG_16_40_8]